MEPIIHIEDKQTNRILDYIPEDNYWNEVRKRKLSNGSDVFDFETFADKSFSEHINDQNRIVIPDKQFGFAEFIIDDFEKVKNDTTKINVYTTASFLLLKKSKPIAPFKSSTDTATKHVTDALANNDEWQVGKIAHTTLRSFNVEEYTNTYSLLKLIASTFGLELQFRISIENGEVIRYVDMVESIGKWRGFEIAYKHNLTGIERRSKSGHVVTALLGLSPADSDGNRKEVLVTDEKARQRWGYVGKDGKKQHYYATYTPESSDQDMTTDRLRTLTENELEKRVKAKYEYEVDFHILGDNVYFGDTVRVRDEEFNPPLYLDARIHTLEEGLKESSQPKAVLGDYVEYTEAEATALFKLLQKQVASKIEGAELREYTYEKLTIDNKDEVVFEEGKTFAELQASNALEDAKADAEQKASAAQTAAEEYALAKANLAETQAKSHADGKVSAEEQARIDADTAKLAEAKQHAETKADEAEAAAEDYTNAQLTNYIAATQYDNDLAGIQAQIDNQITSHFKDYEPTLNNLPASDWTDNATKDKHIGDLFYNSSTGYSYRFMVDNGTYKWTLVRDEGIAKALQDASEAQDTADSKRRVFVSQPTTPYDKGDLWDNNGAVYRSTVDKSNSATFSSSDWVRIGDVTNENTANDTEHVGGRPSIDIEDIQGAQDKADAAQEAAEIAAEEVAIAKANLAQTQAEAHADGIVSTEEQARIDADIAKLEEAKADAKAKANAAESAAKGHADTVANTAEQNAKDHADTVSGQALIDAQNYAVAQQVYDNKMGEIANDLSDKAGIEYVDGELVRVIDDLEIGGRNLATDSHFNSGSTNGWRNNYGVQEVVDSVYIKTFDETHVANRIERDFNGVLAGTYTLSIYAELPVNLNWRNFVNASVLSQSDGTAINGFKIYTVTFDVPNDANITVRGYIPNVPIGEQVKLDWFKLEKGNKATDWTPAPEDVQSDIATKADASITYTIEEVDNALLNYVGVTEYTTDMDGVVQDLNSHSTRLGQNETAIGLKADQTELDTVAGTVSDHSATLDVQAQEISQKVEADYVNTQTSQALSDAKNHSDNKVYIIPNDKYESDVAWTSYSNRADYMKMKHLNTETWPFRAGTVHTYGYNDSWAKQVDYDVYTNRTKERIWHKDNGWSNWRDTEDTTGSQRKVDNAVGPINTTIEQHSTEITQNATAITSKAESSVVDTLTGRVDSAESTISQHADQIQSKVDDGEARSIFTQEANSFTFDASQVEFTGHVFGKDATFKGDLQGATITQTGNVGSIVLDDEGFSLKDSNGSDRMVMITDDTNYAGYTPSVITFEPKTDWEFMLGTGAHGLGDGALGYTNPNPSSNAVRTFNIYNEGNGMIQLFTERIRMGTEKSSAEFDKYGNLEAPRRVSDTGYWAIKDYSGSSIFLAKWGTDPLNEGVQVLDRNFKVYNGDLEVNNGRIINQETHDTTTSANANMYVASNGYYARSTSAKKYKRDIKYGSVDYTKILNIQPADWIDDAEYTKNGDSAIGLQRYYGAIADQFEEVGLPEYAVYENGEIENFNDRAWTLLIPNINDLIKRVEKLEAR